MGHIIDYIPVDKREDIFPAAHDFAHVNVNRNENWDGSYHGNMTILDDVEPLSNYDAAVEYLSERSQSARRSYSDYAVRYYSSNGDGTQFFHLFANSRRLRNRLPRVSVRRSMCPVITVEVSYPPNISDLIKLNVRCAAPPYSQKQIASGLRHLKSEFGERWRRSGWRR